MVQKVINIITFLKMKFIQYQNFKEGLKLQMKNLSQLAMMENGKIM